MTERHIAGRQLGLMLGLAILLSLVSSFASAQEEHEKSAGELAKAAQNPVAGMISLPFQNNFNFNVGPHKQLQNILNIQPVVPISSTMTGI